MSVRPRRFLDPRRRGLRRTLLVLALLGVAGCGRDPVTPDPTVLELVVAGGDGQYGTAGQSLPNPLRVALRDADSKLPAEEASVQWVVTSGDADIEGPSVVITDEAGIAEIDVVLGSSEGEITVTAASTDQPSATVTLRAFLVGAPALTSLEPTTADAGGTVVLTGENFSPVAEQNVVLFSGIRGRVVSATSERMEVEVPACLPTRDGVGVLTRLGSVASDSLQLSVRSTGAPPTLDVGDVWELDDPAGLACVRLPGGDGVQYLALARSAGTVGAARHPFAFVGLASGGGDLLAAPSVPLTAPLAAAAPVGAGVGSVPGAQAIFEEALRAEEWSLVEGRSRRAPFPSSAPTGIAPAPAAVPQVGHVREFWVYNGSDDPSARFDRVSATARRVSQRAVIYVDDAAPSAGFTEEDFQTFAHRFDDLIHPTVTGAFGAPSDLDGNDRIVILFTPVVNGLTPRDSDSFVGGFFYGRDLLPELSSSNAGEVFYALVPDPEAEYSDARSRAEILHSVPSVLAHEFQHMVHFNQRVLELGADQEALWMLESLAQMAEELVARAHVARGEAEEAVLYREGNRARARLYLSRPDTVSLIVASGRGSLAERGAGLLFLLYLDAQVGGDVLARLTATDRTGVDNVSAAVGESWENLVSDWWTAVFLELARPSWWQDSGPWAYPGVDLGGFLGVNPQAPLTALFYQQGGANDFGRTSYGVLPSSAGRYFVLVPRLEGELAVAFAGEGGGAHQAGAAMGLRILRLR